MSGEATDTQVQFFQFLAAYDADYVSRDGRLVIDDPEVRRRLIEAIDAYTAVYRKGCTPPGSITWDSDLDNNEQFLAQAVVMTLNDSLSIPNALKRERPDDYYENTATIEWPLGPDGEAFPIRGMFHGARGLQGRPQRRDRQGVRPLPRGRGLARALSRLRGRAHAAADAEATRRAFWLDPSDRHRMAAVMQIASRPMDYCAACDWRYDLVWEELTWAKAIHRVAAEGISPEQAVDEAIVRIKEIFSE